MMEDNYSIKEKIVKNSIWAFGGSILNRFGALFLTILLARFLMPEGYGIYSIVLSTAMIFLTFTNLGVNTTLMRYLSSAIKKNKEQIPTYHRYLLKIKIILATSSFLLFLLLSYPFAFFVYKNSQLFFPFLVASFYILIFSFNSFYKQVFYSIEKIKYASLNESLSQFLKIIFALFIFYFIASSYHIIGIFFSFIIVSFLMIFFNLYYIKKLLPEFFLKPKIRIDKRKVKKFVGVLSIASISTGFFYYLDSIMLGIFVSPEYVGYYGTAFSLVFGIIGILSFASLVLLPVFTKANKRNLKLILEKTIRYLFMIIIPSIFGLLILGKYFIVAFFGHSYLSSVLPFYFLVPLLFPVVLVGLFLSLFLAEERPEIFAKLVGSVAVINVILNIVFIKLFLLISPLWATVGAAIATLFSWALYFFLSVQAIRKEFRISISFSTLIRPLIASLIMTGVLFYTFQFIEDMNVIFGIGEVIFGGLIYILSMLLIKGIKKEDISLLGILFKK